MPRTNDRKSVVYSFAVGQQHHTEISTVHLVDRRPAANTTVRLNHLPYRMLGDMLDPLQANHRTIRAETDRFEVSRELQRAARPTPLLRPSSIFGTQLLMA